ncbi:MAG: hypothetical protein ACE145_08275 [Terriglobia bacterium]
MRNETLFSVGCLALLVWGCPKRQTTTHIIYTPAPPAPAAQNQGESSGAMVIEEPAPPEPEETAPLEEPVTPKPAPKRRVPVRTQTPSTPDTAEPDEQPAAEVPALEPREAPGQQAALRQQIQRSQDRLRQRLAELDRQISSAADRRMADDARSFLAQSERAVADGDLQRALNLTRKTSLLVAALEQER